jgi:hypothetical protein
MASNTTSTTPTANSGGDEEKKPVSLCFPFRDRRVPVSYLSSVTAREAAMAIQSEPLTSWYRRFEKVSHDDGSDCKLLELHSVVIQRVDLFGERYVNSRE